MILYQNMPHNHNQKLVIIDSVFVIQSLDRYLDILTLYILKLIFHKISHQFKNSKLKTPNGWEAKLNSNLKNLSFSQQGSDMILAKKLMVLLEKGYVPSSKFIFVEVVPWRRKYIDQVMEKKHVELSLVNIIIILLSTNL